ncbi:hypothetical protein B566_EDAN011080, partial [Ephemera danica]
MDAKQLTQALHQLNKNHKCMFQIGVYASDTLPKRCERPAAIIANADEKHKPEQEEIASTFIFRSKPKYKNFTTKEDRLKSFKYWPKAIQQTPEDLASNGFHYTGCGDRVICFDCGLGLKDWHEEDTPPEEHRRYSPNCNFLKWTAECQETSNKKSNTASLQCRKCLQLYTMNKYQSVRYLPYVHRNTKVEILKCAPKQEQQKSFAELKSREILRVSFPLNRSSSKQIAIALDPGLDFTPVITIGRAGWSGIRMTAETFNVLCSYGIPLLGYFEDQGQRKDPILLSSQEMLEFHKNWGKNIIAIASNLDSSEKVTLAKTSWEGFVKIIPLMQHMIQKYESWQTDAMEIYQALVKSIKSQLSPDELMSNPVMQNTPHFKDIVYNTHFESLSHDPLHSNIDVHQVFYELPIGDPYTLNKENAPDMLPQGWCGKAYDSSIFETMDCCSKSQPEFSSIVQLQSEFEDENVRLKTFPSSWNYNASRQELVKSGFIYNGTNALTLSKSAGNTITLLQKHVDESTTPPLETVSSQSIDLGDAYMNEIHRYKSFPTTWNFNATRRELAWSGFAYFGTESSPDRVICCFCGFTLSNFTEDDHVHFMHKTMSPTCPRITGVDCKNITFPQDEDIERNDFVIIDIEQASQPSQNFSRDYAMAPLGMNESSQVPLLPVVNNQTAKQTKRSVVITPK